MSDETFGGRIRARALALGIVDDRGRATAARLAEFLSTRWRIEVKPRTVEAWLANERVPRTGRMVRLLTELTIHGDERDELLALAAEVEPDEAPPIDSPAAADVA